MVKYRDSKVRSVVKSVSYRAIIVTADATIILVLTHRYDIALTVVVVSNIYSTLLYFGHERIWDRIKWGRLKT
ncbi:MAG TPA: DUF2061 domain-containing protein [Candidatus Nanoarchaeia archaeon]|nr:DUF2061 domain-containing protein [Candidatus Nanoarchaeia archaeon]